MLKVKDVMAALESLDPELECSLELLPSESDLSARMGGPFGIPFKVEPHADSDGCVVRVFFAQTNEPEIAATSVSQGDPVLIVDLDGSRGRVRVLKSAGKRYRIEVNGLVRNDGLTAEEAISGIAIHMSNTPMTDALTRTAFGHTPAT